MQTKKERKKGEYSKVHGWDCSSCNAGIPRLNKEVYPNVFQMWEARSQVWMLTAVLSPSIALAVGILQEWFLAARTGYITPLALFSHFSSPVITHPVKSNLLRSDSIIFLWACNMFFVNLCNWIYHPKYFMLNILERNGQVLDSFLLWISKINIFFMLIDCVYKTLVPNSYRAHPAFNKAVKLFFFRHTDREV